MEHRFAVYHRDARSLRGAPHQIHGMLRVVAVVQLGTYDLAAVQIQDQVQVESQARHLGVQVAYVPAPHLYRGCGDVGCWRCLLLRRPLRDHRALSARMP